MPSPAAHLAAGYGIYRFIRWIIRATGQPAILKPEWCILPACLVFSMLPDTDSVLGILFQNFGNYHNQASHSLLVATLPALLAALATLRLGLRTALAWGELCLLCYVIHIGMDYLGFGRGVKLLWPLTDQRYISPFMLFYGLRWSNGPWSIQHLYSLLNETLFCLLLLPPVVYLTSLRKQRDAECLPLSSATGK